MEVWKIWPHFLKTPAHHKKNNIDNMSPHNSKGNVEGGHEEVAQGEVGDE